METQNMMKESYEITILSFVFSPYHPFVIHFVKSSVFLYLENLGDNPYLIVILNHGGNIKPHFLLKSSSKLQIPHLSSLYSEQVQWVSILFIQFKCHIRTLIFGTFAFILHCIYIYVD